MGLGASIVSNNILENKANIKWILRESSVNELDNGWRFLSEIDTEEYLSHAENMSTCDWSTIVEIEPAVLSIFNMPIGTELILIYEGEKKYFIDTNSGQKLSYQGIEANFIYLLLHRMMSAMKLKQILYRFDLIYLRNIPTKG